MIFEPLALSGAFHIRSEPFPDDRGFFARIFCQREFARHGLSARVAQSSLSFNRSRHTLRGMHYQVGEHAEVKLVRCTAGSIHDVIIDLRPGSSTYLQHVAVTLSAGERNLLYVPAGFAHGFLTLEDETEVCYQISEFYAPEAARGARWDDPAFGIDWPHPPAVISERDRSYPDYKPLERA
jgi:dTDP-4-dehydrorhamnose 3,5-epimerase